MNENGNKKIIWITGGAGFLGRHLGQLINTNENSNHVYGLGHGSWTENEYVRWGFKYWINSDISIDILNKLSNLTGLPDIIFHLAGGASVGAAIDNPKIDFDRTVGASIEVLEWIRLNSPETRLVAVSSAAVYGSGYEAQICESSLANPYSVYGYNKFIMENLCKSYASSYGLRIVIPRIFSVYGPHLQKQLLWDLCNKISVGSKHIALAGSGQELRDWADVSDVTRALVGMVNLASRDVPILNIGTGIGTTVKDVVKRVIENWEINIDFSFNGQSRTGDPFSLIANPNLLFESGFKFFKTLDVGVSSYVKWFRKL